MLATHKVTDVKLAVKGLHCLLLPWFMKINNKIKVAKSINSINSIVTLPA